MNNFVEYLSSQQGLSWIKYSLFTFAYSLTFIENQGSQYVIEKGSFVHCYKTEDFGSLRNGFPTPLNQD